MHSKTPPSRMNKRPNEDSSTERLKKSPYGVVKSEDNSIYVEKTCRFRILLPNGTTLELKMNEMRKEMPIEEFVDAVKREYYSSERSCKRRIKWDYKDLHFTDAQAKKIRLTVNFQDFMPRTWHILKLHDGSVEPETYEDMWDLTPDTDLLKELPEDYTFETALADLIDNSLQAVWSNRDGERKFISVKLAENRISIFDSGPGMDGTDGNIAKWGKMGSSLHRASRSKAVGGKPPYLMPFFGMFGYGGPVATMHLGRRAVVSSKTRSCNKVFMLHLEKDALINNSNLEKRWRTKGGMRDPSQGEKDNSPHGSYTKILISDLKMRSLDIKLLQYTLKDIYFPYIQCDDTGGKTRTPIEFEVNGIDLTEVDGGEVATTNLHSCNGREFILQLHFTYSQDTSSVVGQRENVVLDAHARLKCVYFPILEGEESINRIIKKLEEDGYGIRESYEGFSRVSIRRLGRLLPDARWAWLPFMEPKQRKGEKAQILKRCCFRVKCFVETDSGFNPTPSKTDLAHHHPYTTALKNFGNITHGNNSDVEIEISRDGKKLNLSSLEKQYHDWILQMHDRYDDEMDTGLDESTIIVPSKDKKLGTFPNVVRVHKEISRKGSVWKAGEKIKILKGACTGCHKNNVFATVEYFILDGLQGDSCGEARVICRPLGVPEDRGCSLTPDNIDIRSSMSIPLGVIDSGKCEHIDDVEWKNKLDKFEQKSPSTIDLLSSTCCKELEIEGGLLKDEVEAGDAPPENIVAVVRPKAFSSASNSRKLDQRFIVRENYEMSLEVHISAGAKNVEKSEHLYSTRMEPSARAGFHGLYIFPLRSSKVSLFEKAGLYTFSFKLKDLKDLRFKQDVLVNASTEFVSWRLSSPKSIPGVRVGSFFPSLSVVCDDRYGNCVPFECVPNLTVKLMSRGSVLANVRKMKVDVTTDNSTMTIKDMFIVSNNLDKIRPSYKASLNISTSNEEFSLDCPCQVIPGYPEKIIPHPRVQKRQLLPDQILDELALEVLDSLGNHVSQDDHIFLDVDGFSFSDSSIPDRKVDRDGYVRLSNILKVSKGYGKDVVFSVKSREKTIFKLDFQTEIRELHTATKVFEHCEAGSQLKDIMFEIIDSEGVVDETIDDDDRQGQHHTLKITSNSFDVDDSVRYSFRHGRCSIRAIPLPQTEGVFFFKAAHTRYPELNLDIEVHVEKVWRDDHDVVGYLEDFGNSEPPTPNSLGDLITDPQSTPSRVLEVVHGSSTPRSLKKYMPPFNSSPNLQTPKQDHHSARDGRILPIHVPETPDVGNLTGCSLDSLEELTEDITNCGLKIGERERKLDMLRLRRLTIRQEISNFQDFPCVSTAFRKESIRKQIENISESAAAVVYKSLKQLQFEKRPDDILGIVALLGSVQRVKLSRMLAKYLGEEQMLAIVCKNYAAAETFENHTLHKLEAKFGQSVTGGYQVFCLEDVRPIVIEPSNDPKEPLPLPIPALHGNTPQGFHGYAVNLVSVEESHLEWRTKSGHNLRETLFYRLLGELQVYEDKDCMKMAQSCIRDGAISLDGGIMRGNGVVSLGKWEPTICFPVRNGKLFSSDTMKMIEEKKSELTELSSQMEEETRLYETDCKNFQLSHQRFKDFENVVMSQRSSQK